MKQDSNLIPQIYGDSSTIIEEEYVYPISQYSYCEETDKEYTCSAITNVGTDTFNDCKIPNSKYLSSNITTVDIVSGISSIGDYAFTSCDDLSQVKMANSVVEMGIYSFGNCSKITDITLSYGLDKVNDWSFGDCSQLTTVTIPTSITSINNDAFAFSNITAVTIPENVTNINSQAFFNCHSLKTVTLPSTLSSIGACAFWYCDNLSVLNYNGTKQQWGRIKLENFWNTGTKLESVICSDGTLSI